MREQSSTKPGPIQRGLPHEHLVPGALVTISPNKQSGDRSFSHAIWEILASNPGHVLVRARSVNHPPDKATTLLQMHEHEFYAAEHLYVALTRTAKDTLILAKD